MAVSARVGGARVDPKRLAQFAEFPVAAWMQYASDGSRVLVVDMARGLAIRIQLRPSEEQLAREGTIRARVGDAAPEIVEIDPSNGVLAERWMSLRAVEDAEDALERAMDLLCDRLYAVDQVPLGSYLETLRLPIERPAVQAFLQARAGDALPVTDVHGDLWPGNLGIAAEGGRLMLLDWEYARPCVETHDLWSFMVQRRREAGAPLDGSFLTEFASRAVRWFALPMDSAAIAARHLVHLGERYSHFQELGLSHKANEMDFLRNEMIAVMRR